MEIAISGLHASLLVRHPNDKKKLFVNFDPDILTLMRETECISRMGLNIPYIAMPLKQKQSVFKKSFNKLEVNFANLYCFKFSLLLAEVKLGLAKKSNSFDISLFFESR